MAAAVDGRMSEPNGKQCELKCNKFEFEVEIEVEVKVGKAVNSRPSDCLATRYLFPGKLETARKARLLASRYNGILEFPPVTDDRSSDHGWDEAVME